MAKFNGHKNWNHWNVSLWILNDGALCAYAEKCLHATDSVSAAAAMFMDKYAGSETPDGAPYSKSAVRAALVGM